MLYKLYKQNINRKRLSKYINFNKTIWYICIYPTHVIDLIVGIFQYIINGSVNLLTWIYVANLCHENINVLQLLI